jgi:hypothetical protein
MAHSLFGNGAPGNIVLRGLMANPVRMARAVDDVRK